MTKETQIEQGIREKLVGLVDSFHKERKLNLRKKLPHLYHTHDNLQNY